MDFLSFSPLVTPLGDMSLNTPERSWSTSLSPLVHNPHSPHRTQQEQHYVDQQCRWSVPAWTYGVDASTKFGGPSRAWPSATPAYNVSGTGAGVFAPHLYLPELHFRPSPSETCSSLSGDSSAPPDSPVTDINVHVVCADIPLVAPKPLPYHSPTFLQFDRLPDVEEDLSHPPYTRRPTKRKRDADNDYQEEDLCPAKRRHQVSHPYPAPAQYPHAFTRHRPAPYNPYHSQKHIRR